LIVLVQATVGDIVSPRERGRYQGLFGAVFGLASVAGPLLGGVIVEIGSTIYDGSVRGQLQQLKQKLVSA